LDDYRRSPLPSEQEFHLDLFCWIFTAARVMSRLERTLLARAHKEGAVAKKIAAIQKTMGGLTYDNFAGRLQSRLEFLHWSHPHQVAKGSTHTATKGCRKGLELRSSDVWPLSRPLFSLTPPHRPAARHGVQVFCDVGYSSDLAVVVTDLAMRCQNQETGKVRI